ncbi:probable reticulon-like protein B18 [Coccomyxa sp. Obi]|nr:probable reticulon-like protein B18 [Coccomyxa sp. Obi]
MADTIVDDDFCLTPPMTLQKTDYLETPAPFVGRAKPQTVSFKEDGSATATATLTLAQGKGSYTLQRQQVEDVLRWRNPAISALVFLLGSFCCLAGEFILRGSHTLTPLKAISYCILLDLGLNTLRGMVSAQWQDKAAWGSSSLIKTAADTARAAVLKMADLHDQFLAARDPVLTLRLACAFSALSVLGSVFSIWRLVCLTFFGAFAAGAAYENYGTQINSFIQTGTNIIKERWQALALSRRHKAIALCVALWILWINVNWTARAQAILLGALTVRCNLKPAEVDAIISHAEPYMHSAKKRARRMSLVANDFVRRHSVALTHSKPHDT